MKNLLEDYIQALEEYRVPGEALKITRAITKAPVFANPLRRWKRCHIPAEPAKSYNHFWCMGSLKKVAHFEDQLTALLRIGAQ